MKAKKTRMNESTRWLVGSNIVMLMGVFLSLAPFVLLLIASFTDDQTAVKNGFSFFPEKWSMKAYQYVAGEWATIGHAYLMTILVVIVGTCLTILVTSLFAYALSNDQMPGVRFFTFLLIFSMMFGGGQVATYYIWVRVFHIRNTFWALILPNLLMSPFNVILVRNYFKWSIPKELAEAARIDGASELKIFYQIMLPLSVPILATIGLMSGLAYWNDWTNGLYYLTERDGSQFYTIQIILNTINENVSFLAQNASKLGNLDISSIPSTTVRFAIAVIGILPIMAIYPFFQKYYVKGIVVGGVKG